MFYILFLLVLVYKSNTYSFIFLAFFSRDLSENQLVGFSRLVFVHTPRLETLYGFLSSFFFFERRSHFRQKHFITFAMIFMGIGSFLFSLLCHFIVVSYCFSNLIFLACYEGIG